VSSWVFRSFKDLDFKLFVLMNWCFDQIYWAWNGDHWWADVNTIMTGTSCGLMWWQ
jgi:hypothetical protein